MQVVAHFLGCFGVQRQEDECQLVVACQVVEDSLLLRLRLCRVHLLDDARQALGVETRTLTSLVTPGYAPFEQYNANRDGDKQGPWTDIYALGATLYRAVTGKGPVDALTRAGAILKGHKDVLVPATMAGRRPASSRFSRQERIAP